MESLEQPSRTRGCEQALRQVARRDPGARPLVGFADPVFDPAERARALAELYHRLEFVGRVEQRRRGFILSAV
jgi:hypothetical protein